MAWHLATASSIAYHRRFTDAARSRLDEAFLFINPNLIFMAMIGGAVVIPLGIWLLTGNLFWAIVSGSGALAAPKVAYFWINRKRRLKMVLQLPDVLLMLASSLRSGTSLQIAMDIAIRETPAPLSQELGVVMREQRLGLAMEDALQTMGARLKMEEIDLVVERAPLIRGASPSGSRYMTVVSSPKSLSSTKVPTRRPAVALAAATSAGSGASWPPK